MTIFVVMPDNVDSRELATAMSSKLSHGDYLKLPGGAWLVSHAGTTRELSDLLGISTGNPTNGVVCGISGYWGRQDNNVWEWMKSKSN